MPTMLERLDELSDRMEKIDALLDRKDEELGKAIIKTFDLAKDPRKPTAPRPGNSGSTGPCPTASTIRRRKSPRR